MTKLNYFLFLLLGLFSTNLPAQNIKLLQNLGITSDLNDNKINDFIIDSDGLIWISTPDKTFRYTGSSVNPFVYPSNYFSHKFFNTGNYMKEISSHKIAFFGNGISIYDKINHTAKNYTDTNGLTDIFVTNILPDSSGKGLYIFTWQGLDYLDFASDSIYNFNFVDELGNNIKNLYHIKEAILFNNKIWFLSFKEGLFSFDPNTKRVTHIPINVDASYDFRGMALCDSVFYLSNFNDGIYTYHVATKQTEQILLDGNPKNNEINHISNYPHKQLLLSSENGIILYDTKTKNYRIINKENYFTEVFNSNTIIKCIADTSGNIYCATSSSGFFIFNKNNLNLEVVNPPKSVNLIYNTSFKFDPKEGVCYLRGDASKNKNCQQNCWVKYIDASFYSRLPVIHLENNKRIFCSKNDLTIYTDLGQKITGKSFGNKTIWAIFNIDNSVFLILDDWTLYNLDLQNLSISQVKQFNFEHSLNEYFLSEDKKGLWLNVYGITYYFDLSTYQFNYDPLFERSEIVCLDKNDVWIREFKNYYKINNTGFIIDSIISPKQQFKVFSIDQKSRIWTSNGNSLSCWTKNTHKEWEEKRLKLASSFYFPGYAFSLDKNGYISIIKDKIYRIHTDSIDFDYTLPNILLDGLVVNGKNVFANQKLDGQIILAENITYASRIELTKGSNNFSINLGVQNPLFYSYSDVIYKLDGYDTDLKQLDASYSIAYEKLPKGNYQLSIFQKGHEHLNKPLKTLEIYVKPEFYETLFFRFILSFGLVLSFYIFYWQRTKNLRNRKIILEKTVKQRTAELLQKQEEITVQAENLSILNATKDRFFSIIAHDLRNPFMGITGLATILYTKGNEIESSKKSELLSQIITSSTAAGELLENLLTWSNSQSAGIKPQPETIKVKNIVSEVFNLSLTQAKKKKINLKDNVPSDTFLVCDKNMLKTIVRNIISNAIKFTETGGQITVSAMNEVSGFISIIISDTGIGMSENAIQKLFRIDQKINSTGTSGEHGTGLGLIVCKEFIEANNGSIKVKSQLKKGTDFIISFPIAEPNNLLKPDSKPYKKDEIFIPAKKYKQEDNLQKNSETKTSIFKEKKILVIDDDKSLLSAISEYLSDSYKIITLSDSELALEKIFEIYPDLIISDIEMPKINGIDLAKSIRANQDISHIPIILLTAKSSQEDQVKGLQTKVNDYLLKPFKPDLLQLKIDNIFYHRISLWQKFSINMLINKSNSTTLSPEEQFIESAFKVVEKHLSNPNLNVDEFAKEMGVGRSWLYAKMENIIGMPISEFIKLVRIKKAAALLREGKLSVSEIAYQVGYNTHSSFSRAFKLHFGTSPSEYMNQ